MIEYYFHQNFPVLDLDDIILREINDDDATDYFEYMSRPEMSSFLSEANFPKNLDQAFSELRYWGGLFRNKRSFYWAIALKQSNRLIGTAGFNTISIVHSKAEISYDLNFDYWGKGIMLKSIKNILKFADYKLQLMRVQATVITDNERSINLLQRCGFNNEGILRKFEVINSVHKDYFLYARVN